MSFFSRLFRKLFPSPQEVATEKIIAKLNTIKNLIIILQAIFTLETFIRSLPMALDPAVQAALDAAKQKIADAITKEVQDVKDLVAAGASPADVVAALDEFGNNVAASIDTISTGGPPQASPGNTTTTG